MQAEAVIIQQGRTIAVLEATVYNVVDEEKRSIARVLGTFHISTTRPGKE
jgi:acyl-coenzyme A thioesterase PaaI-like protein